MGSTTDVWFAFTGEQTKHRPKDIHGSQTHLVNHTIPATTRVDEWINADTADGPSMASGNHECTPEGVCLALVVEYGAVPLHALDALHSLLG